MYSFDVLTVWNGPFLWSFRITSSKEPHFAFLCFFLSVFLLSIDAFPLLVAAQNGHYDVCKFLVRRHSIAGVTVDWKTDMGVTPLFAASRQGFQEITELLISYGANPWLKTNDGLSVLDAVRTYHVTF